MKWEAWGRCGLSFVLAVLSFLWAAALGQKELAKVGDAVLFTVPSEKIFTWEESQERKKDSSTYQVGAGGSCSVEEGKVFFLDEAYQRLAKIQVEAGELLSFGGQAEALLDLEQAAAFQVQIGDRMKLGEKEYLVKGILAPKKTLVERLAEPVYGTIYVNEPPQKEAYADKLLFWGEREIYARDSSYELNSLYGQVFEGKFQSLAMMKDTLRNLGSLFLFFAFLPGVWFLVTAAYRFFVQAYERWGSSRAYGGISFAGGLLFTAIACALWIFLFQRIDLPQQYLPQEHIFDVGYYAQELAGFYKSLWETPGEVEGIRVLACLGAVQGIAGLFSTICFWRFWHWGKQAVLSLPEYGRQGRKHRKNNHGNSGKI